jgi:hypothetical protein
MAAPKVLGVISDGNAVSVRRRIGADAQFSLATFQFYDSGTGVKNGRTTMEADRGEKAQP